MPNHPILAYVTPHMNGVRIIDCALSMAKSMGRELSVVTVLPGNSDAKSRADDVKCLKMMSDICGVDITVRYSDRPFESLINHIGERIPSHIFMGENNSLLTKVKELFGFVPISVVTSKTVFTVSA